MISSDNADGNGPEGSSVTPVSYDTIKHLYQPVRLAGAVALLSIALIAMVNGIDGAVVKTAAMGLLVADAAWRSIRSRNVLPSLIADVVLIGASAGVGTNVDGPLVVFAAYLVTSAILLLSPRQILALLAATSAVVALRTTMTTHAEQFGSTADALQWAEICVYLVGLTMVLLAGVKAIRATRKRQTAVLQSERRTSAMKNQFVTTVSHELRTPLTNIAGFAFSLHDSWRDITAAEVDDFLAIICDEANHLREIVDRVLLIPRLEAGRLTLEPTDFPLRPVAYRAADQLFPKGGNKAATVAVVGNVYLRADPNRVEHILRNLLDNARKYGGDRVGVDAIERNGDWEIIVADNGPGVPEADRERIFGRFEQLEHGDTHTSTGMGLGLTISRLLVEAMGGEMWYEPGFPVGARFCFRLPAGPAPALGSEAAEEVHADPRTTVSADNP
jgi:signal transduction histidine kinase